MTDEVNTLPDILTVQEVAQLLRVDKATVYRLAQRGRIPAVKIGAAWRFLRVVLDEWLRAGGTAAGDTASDDEGD